MPKKLKKSREPLVPSKSSKDYGKGMLDSAFEHVMVPLAILDRKFNFIRVNKAFVQLSGMPAQDLSGRNYFEFFPSSEDVEIFMHVLNTSKPYIARGKPVARIRSEGHTKYWDWSLNPVLSEAGEVNHLVLSWNDVTEREQAKLKAQAAHSELEFRVEQRTRELRETEEMLNVALEAAELGTWIWDLVSGKAVWSKYRRELFGLDQNREITFEAFIESVVPEDREKVRRAILDALEERTVYNVEMGIELPDGSRRWLRTRGRGFYDEKDKPARLVGMAWDVTEPRTIRERLRESEERLRLATEAANEAVWDWDCATGQFISNDVYIKNFGHRQQQCKDWPYDPVHPDDRDRVRESFQQALKSHKEDWSIEYQFRKADGNYAYIQDRAFLIRDESGRVKRMIGAMLDLTERKRIEEELERRTQQLLQTNKEMESFSYIVSHDLRSPVRAMEGYTKMILKDYADQFDQELKRRFDVILESTTLMNEMIEAMLILSRASQADLRITDCDMKAIFQDVWETVSKENSGRKIRFTLQDMPVIKADCTLMRQAVYNLLSNAAKFTRKRKEAVVEVGFQDDGEHVFYVKDNGTGFEIKYADQLFTMFKRLHSQKEYKGTGIGLPIVQRIVSRHGGRVWAEGAVNKGATFYFSLPK